MNNLDLEALFRTLEQAGYMPVPITATIEIGDVVLNKLHKSVQYGDRVIYLWPMTFDALYALAQVYPKGLDTPSLSYAIYKSCSPRLMGCMMQHIYMARRRIGNRAIVTLNAKTRYRIFRFNPEGVRFA